MAPPGEGPYARGFATDARTERALAEALAKREVVIERGRAAFALRTLATEPSPRLVFVDFDGAREPQKTARELAAICAPGTVLVVIGSTDTAEFTRMLFRHGITDYLVKPITAAAVREACATALDEVPERLYAGRVVAFAGTAGSGVSTLVAAIAHGVGAAGRTAAIVNLNPMSETLFARLGARPTGDLSALLAALDTDLAPSSEDSDPPLDPEPAISPEQIGGVCAAAGRGISLVAHANDEPMSDPPSPTAVCRLLESLANRSHLVLATGMLDSGMRTEIMRFADARVLLYEPTLASIGTAVQTLALVGADQDTTLVQCHPRMRRSALTPAQIRYALAERRPDVVIPFDQALHMAATGRARGRSRSRPYLDSLRRVMARVVEGTMPVSAV